MAGSTWVTGWFRAFSSRRAAWLLLGVGSCATANCTLPAQGDPPPLPSETGSAGAGFAVGGSSFGGGEAVCAPIATTTPVFADQGLSTRLLFTREFYSWTTDSQALTLRTNRALFTVPAGTGVPFSMLDSLASPLDLTESTLAQALGTAFQMGRYAWPEPWATRMGGNGRDPGGQLVRIVIKPEAWLAIVQGGHVAVYDAQKQLVSSTDALATPERIGVIYFDSSFLDPNGCGGVGSGERQFLLGNASMVEEWSIGTQQIVDRLTANVAQLTSFLSNIRACPVTEDAASWTQSVVCSWQNQLAAEAGAPSTDPSAGGAFGAGGSSFAGGVGVAGSGAVGVAGTVGFDPARFGASSGFVTEEFAYDMALSFPNASYLAAPAEIATMIETLQGDLFEPDPLVVTPGSP